MAQARSNIPTVAERLKDRTVSTPSISSRYLSEYDEKKANYVNPDRNAGAGMAALARSLQGFNKEFDKAATAKLDKMVEEDVARGDYIFSSRYDSEDALRNRKEWKQLIKEKPELAGLSPWVAVGYERSRLRELGIEMKSGLKKYIDEQGLLNAEDPQRVQGAINQYIKEFRDQAGLNSYNDKLLIAENFSPIEAEARKAVTNTYDQVQMAQRESKMVDQYSSEMATRIAAAEEAGIPVDVESLQALGKEAVENGMDASRLPALFLSAYQTAYAKSKNRKTLNSIERLVIGKDSNGKDITLKDNADAARWWRVETDKNINEDAEKERKYQIDSERYRKDTAEAVASKCIFNTEGQPLNREQGLEEFKKALGRELTEVDLAEFHAQWNRVTAIRLQAINQDNVNPTTQAARHKEVSNLYENYSGKALESALEKRWIETGDTIFKEAWDDVRSGTDANSKAYAAQVKEDRKTLEDRAKSVVKDVASKIDEETPKDTTYIDQFTEGLAQMYLNDFSSFLTEAENDIRSKLPEGRTSLNHQERLQARRVAMDKTEKNVINSGRYLDKLNENKLTMAGPRMNTRSILNNTPPEQLTEMSARLDRVEEYLSSENNPTTYKNTISMAQDIDVVSMLQAGVINPTPQDFLRFSNPKRGLQTAVFSPDYRTVNIPPEAFQSRTNADAQMQWLKATFPSLKSSLVSPSPVTPEERQSYLERMSRSDIEWSYQRPEKGLDARINNQQARMFLSVIEVEDIAVPVSMSTVEGLTAISKAELYDSITGLPFGAKNSLFFRAGLLTEKEVTHIEKPKQKKERRVYDSYRTSRIYQQSKPKETYDFSKLPDEVLENINET